MQRNPFVIESDEIGDRHTEEARDLQSRFEQEIQELDELEIAEGDSARNRMLDRLIPGREKERAERFADAREAAEWGRDYSVVMMDSRHDYELYGPEVSSNDGAVLEHEEQESKD